MAQARTRPSVGTAMEMGWPASWSAFTGLAAWLASGGFERAGRRAISAPDPIHRSAAARESVRRSGPGILRRRHDRATHRRSGQDRRATRDLAHVSHALQEGARSRRRPSPGSSASTPSSKASVVREGEKVRITAKLIRGAGGEIIWAQSYERDLAGRARVAERSRASDRQRGGHHAYAAGAGAHGQAPDGRSGGAPAGSPRSSSCRAAQRKKDLRKAVQYFNVAIARILQTPWRMPGWPKPTSA